MQNQTIYRKVGGALRQIKEQAIQAIHRFSPVLQVNGVILIMLAAYYAGRSAA